MVGSGSRSHRIRLGETSSQARQRSALPTSLLLAGAVLASLIAACTVQRQPSGLLATAPEAAAAYTWDVPTPGGRNLARSGSGFFVSAGGHLVTSAHVVAGCPAIWVQRDGGPPARAALRAIDARNDLALLASDLAAPQIAVLSGRRHVDIGERVLGLGFSARENRQILIRGSVAGRATLPGKGAAFVIRARVPRGASGGLVVNQTGSLVGMIVGYDTDSPGLTIIVASAEIDRFLATHSVRLNNPPAAPRHSDAAERLLVGASAVVQCVPAAAATPPRVEGGS